MLKSQRQIMATATDEEMTGMKKIARKMRDAAQVGVHRQREQQAEDRPGRHGPEHVVDGVDEHLAEDGVVGQQLARSSSRPTKVGCRIMSQSSAEIPSVTRTGTEEKTRKPTMFGSRKR